MRVWPGFLWSRVGDMWWVSVNTDTNLQVPQSVGIFLNISGKISLSRRTLLHVGGWLLFPLPVVTR